MSALLQDQTHTEQLQQELMDNQKFLEELLAEKVASLENIRNNHAATLADNENELRSLASQEQEFIKKGQSLDADIQARRKQIKMLQNETEQSKLKEQALSEEVSAMKRGIQNEIQDLEAERQIVDENNQVHRNKMNELTHGISFYKERLALAFQRVGDDCLRLIFTNIDPQDHSREFRFTVHIDENDLYESVDCEPAVADMDALISVLNKTNDFSQYVQSVRKSWVEGL